MPDPAPTHEHPQPPPPAAGGDIDRLLEGQRLIAEQIALLTARTFSLSEEVRDLAVAQRRTMRRVSWLDEFIGAARREINGSPIIRAARCAAGLLRRRDRGHAAWAEDFVRVYPNGLRYDARGQPRPANDSDRRNWLNHVKFYGFAAQFAAGRTVLDAGCGSGYGCAMLADAGARRVCGIDLSEHALAYARREYGAKAEFRRLSCTALRELADSSFNLVICSEVLEHLIETGEVDAALAELKRVAADDALFVLATPNAELLPGHGFAYGDLHAACRRHFRRFVIFENALVPFEEDARIAWTLRRIIGDVGLTVSQTVNLDETDLPPGCRAELKDGIPPGRVEVGPAVVDTSLLHNTHSFVAVATGRREPAAPPA